jgi:hypothetical protein
MGRKTRSLDATASVEERINPVYSETTEASADHDPKPRRPAQERASTLFGAENEAGKRGRVRDAKDAMKENLLPRVEKIKSVSHDVLDEASVDPSFRFLLVAGVLFVIFILLLILSHILH